MHELALAQSLVRMVVEEAERAQAHSVVTVALSLGALSHVESSSLSLAFFRSEPRYGRAWGPSPD